MMYCPVCGGNLVPHDISLKEPQDHERGVILYTCEFDCEGKCLSRLTISGCSEMLARDAIGTWEGHIRRKFNQKMVEEREK